MLKVVRLPLSFFASPISRAFAAALLALAALSAGAQRPVTARVAARRARVQQFLAERASKTMAPATALARARRELAPTVAKPGSVGPMSGGSLSAAWQALGPQSIVSASYGKVTGRVTSLAFDPNDATGNTMYVGTTGGGVWKSTNAAGPAAAVNFGPLTDTLPVFSANAGSDTLPSLSIGAVAVQPAVNPVVLAGTGDPNDATDSYYGEGVLRSADGGLTWTLAEESNDGANGHHSFSGLSVAGLAFSTGTPSLAVAALSTSLEGALVSATNSTSVPGLYYSADAGATWQMATIYDGASIVQQPQPYGSIQSGNAATSVVWDALRGSFYAALRGHGYYGSKDGVTWTRLSAQPGTTLTTANCPAEEGAGGSATCPIFRGTLAVQPATGDLYALTVDANDIDQGLWQDLCNAASGACSDAAPIFAARLDNGALEIGNGNTAILQGDYNLALAAAPANGGTVLFAGTVDVYRCAMTAGGSSCSLRNTTNAINGCNAPAQVAPAQHALAAIVQASGEPLLVFGNDGGLWRSLDGVDETGAACSASDASHFDNLNGAIGSLAEVTGFAQDPVIADTLIVGAGANGSAATTSAAALMPWPQLSAGEGGYPAIDPNDSANWMVAIGAGVNLKQCTLGSGCAVADFVPPATIGEAQVSYDASEFDAPTMLDPSLTSNVLVGTCRVWRGPADLGAVWSAANAISPALNGGATPCTASSALIRSLGAGGPNAASANAQNSGSQVIYAGMAGALDGGSTVPGAVFVTTAANTANGATAWSNAALNPVTNDTSDAGVFNPLQFDISAVYADPHDATGATVYATVMGFGAPHLYRSMDFGAHWLNISSNLPDAPANAVLVDPNDANTVYVAMDTGVFVTQTVSMCANANCWSVLGTGLPNAPVTALAASANLPTGTGDRGMLRAGTYGRGIWEMPLLTAVSQAQPAITLSSQSLTFGAQQVGTLSTAQTITVMSSGNAPVTFGTPAIAGDFVESDTCAGQTLAVNATCTFSVSFAPTATGARSGQLTIYANIATGQATVALSGTGTAPAAIVLTPLALTFPATIVNQTAAAQIVTVANTGGATATLQTPVVTGDFSIAANTCTSTLAASTGCSVSITFTPTASGTRNGTLSITDSAGTQTATLTGTGQAPATDTLAPQSLSFAQQQVGTSSVAQQVTVTNSGDVALTLLSAAVTGDFTVVNNCGTSLNGHATCALSVAFVPTATGTRSGVLTFTDEVRVQTVTLTGVAVAPPGVSVSPLMLSFGATGVGLSSLAQAVTLTNNGGLALSLSGTTISPGFTIASNGCGASLAVGTACTMQVIFTPTTAGPIAGSLMLTDNAAGGTQTVSLAGMGIDFTLTPNGLTTATLSSGSDAQFPLLLSSLSMLSGNVTFACAGAPAHSSCTVAPATAALGSTVSVVATVDTGLTARLDPGEAAPWLLPRSVIALACGLPLLIFARRKRGLPLAMMLCMIAALSGCGSGRLIPASGPGGGTPATPTPSGTYNLTVSATAAGVTHSVPLTLIVQ